MIKVGNQNGTQLDRHLEPFHRVGYTDCITQELDSGMTRAKGMVVNVDQPSTPAYSYRMGIAYGVADEGAYSVHKPSIQDRVAGESGSHMKIPLKATFIISLQQVDSLKVVRVVPVRVLFNQPALTELGFPSEVRP